MNMKDHILAALKEQFDRWEELLASLNTEQYETLLLPSDWAVKDVIAHLWAWQQRTNARMEAAISNRAPEFPDWLPELDPDDYEFTERVNGWIYQTYREIPWSEIHRSWREGFLHLLESGERIAERDLLDGGKYTWLEGYSLAAYLLGTYDHHQEHMEILQAWLKEHGNGRN